MLKVRAHTSSIVVIAARSSGVTGCIPVAQSVIVQTQYVNESQKLSVSDFIMAQGARALFLASCLICIKICGVYLMIRAIACRIRIAISG